MSGATPSFSLLLPVYAGDRADFLRRAFRSATAEQVLAPTEVVLVQDGPVGDELAAAIAELTATSAVPVVHVELPRNVKLAAALQAGLERCSEEIVARADADDVSLPERFAVQVPLVADGLDLVGSAIREFEVDETRPGVVRGRPTTDAEIRRYATFHNPFNHPSVVYRRSAVMAAGGYEDLPFMEDYWLFVRMLLGGARVANVPDPLVLYRVGAGMVARRGGLASLRSDWVFQRRVHRAGLTSAPQMVRNLAQRSVYRLVPDRVRRSAYRLLVARR